jgi:hypothetical protein
MRRFLSSKQLNKTVESDNLWASIVYLMKDLGAQLQQNFEKLEFE